MQLWGYSSVAEHSTADREVPGSNPGAPSLFYFFFSPSLSTFFSYFRCTPLPSSLLFLSSISSSSSSIYFPPSPTLGSPHYISLPLLTSSSPVLGNCEVTTCAFHRGLRSLARYRHSPLCFPDNCTSGPITALPSVMPKLGVCIPYWSCGGSVPY